VLHLGGVVDFLLVSIKSNHMGIFLSNNEQWINKMMLALDISGWTTLRIYQNIVKKCVRFIKRKNWLIATHELCHIMFFIAPTLFVSCEQIALVDPSSNNLALWIMIHHALPKSSRWLPISTHQVLQYNKNTSQQLDITFHINKKNPFTLLHYNNLDSFKNCMDPYSWSLLWYESQILHLVMVCA